MHNNLYNGTSNSGEPIKPPSPHTLVNAALTSFPVHSTFSTQDMVRKVNKLAEGREIFVKYQVYNTLNHLADKGHLKRNCKGRRNKVHSWTIIKKPEMNIGPLEEWKGRLSDTTSDPVMGDMIMRSNISKEMRELVDRVLSKSAKVNETEEGKTSYPRSPRDKARKLLASMSVGTSFTMVELALAIEETFGDALSQSEKISVRGLLYTLEKSEILYRDEESSVWMLMNALNTPSAAVENMPNMFDKAEEKSTEQPIETNAIVAHSKEEDIEMPKDKEENDPADKGPVKLFSYDESIFYGRLYTTISSLPVGFQFDNGKIIEIHLKRYEQDRGYKYSDLTQAVSALTQTCRRHGALKAVGKGSKRGFIFEVVAPPNSLISMRNCGNRTNDVFDNPLDDVPATNGAASSPIRKTLDSLIKTIDECIDENEYHDEDVSEDAPLSDEQSEAESAFVEPTPIISQACVEGWIENLFPEKTGSKPVDKAIRVILNSLYGLAKTASEMSTKVDLSAATDEELYDFLDLVNTEIKARRKGAA